MGLSKQSRRTNALNTHFNHSLPHTKVPDVASLSAVGTLSISLRRRPLDSARDASPLTGRTAFWQIVADSCVRPLRPSPKLPGSAVRLSPRSCLYFLRSCLVFDSRRRSRRQSAMCGVFRYGTEGRSGDSLPVVDCTPMTRSEENGIIFELILIEIHRPSEFRHRTRHFRTRDRDIHTWLTDGVIILKELRWHHYIKYTRNAWITKPPLRSPPLFLIPI